MPAVERRRLHFASTDELLADAERLAAAPHRTLGQWSLGQILAHLAMFINGSLDGFGFEMPWAMRLLARPMRRRFLRKPPPAGIRFPKRAASVLDPPQVDPQQGLTMLREAAARLKHEPQRHPSPVFGELSVEEWNQLHCRHAELHLGFAVPDETGATA